MVAMTGKLIMLFIALHQSYSGSLIATAAHVQIQLTVLLVFNMLLVLNPPQQF